MAEADNRFSLYVRNRDGDCTARGMFGIECQGWLQAAHVIGRIRYGVRYEPDNVHAACQAHHLYLDQKGREGDKYDWAVSILGLDGWEWLMQKQRPAADKNDEIEVALGRYKEWAR